MSVHPVIRSPVGRTALILIVLLLGATIGSGLALAFNSNRAPQTTLVVDKTVETVVATTASSPADNPSGSEYWTAIKAPLTLSETAATHIRDVGWVAVPVVVLLTLTVLSSAFLLGSTETQQQSRRALRRWSLRFAQTRRSMTALGRVVLTPGSSGWALVSWTNPGVDAIPRYVSSGWRFVCHHTRELTKAQGRVAKAPTELRRDTLVSSLVNQTA